MYRSMKSKYGNSTRLFGELGVKTINDILNRVENDIGLVGELIDKCDIGSVPSKSINISAHIEYAKEISDAHTDSMSPSEIERTKDAIHQTEVRFLRTIDKLNMNSKCMYTRR